MPEETLSTIEKALAINLDEMKYGTALVLISMVLIMNASSIALRVYLRGRKKW